MGPSLDCCGCFVAMKGQSHSSGKGEVQTQISTKQTHTQPLQPASPKPKSQHNSHRNHKHTHTYTHTPAKAAQATHTHRNPAAHSTGQPHHSHRKPKPKQPTPTTATHTHRRSSPHLKHRPIPTQPHFHTSHISTTETKISTQRILGPWQSNSSSPTNHTFECANKVSFQIYRTRSFSQLCSATFHLHCLPEYRLSVLDWDCEGRRDVLHVSMPHAAC